MQYCKAIILQLKINKFKKKKEKLVAQMVKNLPAFWGRSPGEGNGYLLQYFLPGEFHGQRSLADYSLWGRKELDKTEQLRTMSVSKINGAYNHFLN